MNRKLTLLLPILLLLGACASIDKTPTALCYFGRVSGNERAFICPDKEISKQYFDGHSVIDKELVPYIWGIEIVMYLDKERKQKSQIFTYLDPEDQYLPNLEKPCTFHRIDIPEEYAFKTYTLGQRETINYYYICREDYDAILKNSQTQKPTEKSYSVATGDLLDSYNPIPFPKKLSKGSSQKITETDPMNYLYRWQLLETEAQAFLQEFLADRQKLIDNGELEEDIERRKNLVQYLEANPAL